MDSAHSIVRGAVALLNMAYLLLFSLTTPAVAILIDNGLSGDGRLEVDVLAAGESRTVNINPVGSAVLQDIMFDLFHYVKTSLADGAIHLGNTTITAPPAVTGLNEVTSAGSFPGPNGTISWTAVSTISSGRERYITTLTFSSANVFGFTRLIQYADIDVAPFTSNNLAVLGTFNAANFQLVTVQHPTTGNIGMRQIQPQVSNASCIGWAARPYFSLKEAIEIGGEESYTPGGSIVGLSSTTDARFPGAPAYGPADITTAIACDLNPNATSATVVFAISAEADVSAPDTTIVSGPSGTITTTSADFTWTGADNISPTPNLTYAFRLQPLESSFSAFSTATAKSYLALGNGEYTFEVKARDQTGNEDPTPDHRSFTVNVDSIAPDTSIVTGPTGTITTSGVTFNWSGTDNITPIANLTYAFRLVGLEASFSAFTSATTATYSGLANGDYTFLVKAQDQIGNEDASPASRAFTVRVDGHAPDTTISSGPTGTITSASATFTWSGTDDLTATANLTYAFRLVGFETAFSPFGSATTTTYSGLPAGSYTFLVKARDEAGFEDLSPASRPFTVNPASAGTVTEVSGSVRVIVEGNEVTIQPGSSLSRGAELSTGVDGQVTSACDDGNARFSLRPNGSVFLDDALCDPASAGSLDVTSGDLQFSTGPPRAVGARQALPNGKAITVRTPVSLAVVAEVGVEFITRYTQVGKTGTAVTTVQSGRVTVTDPTTGTTSTATPINPTTITGLVPDLVAAVLPTSRSVQVGSSATAFATIINAGAIHAIVCKLALLGSVPATFSYRPTDSTTNQVAGQLNTPVSIPAGGSRSFVFGLIPTGEILPTEVQLGLRCAGTSAAVLTGINTLLLSASTSPVPDIVALAATVGDTGIVNIDASSGAGAFAVATVNVGIGSTITASADTGEASLPVTISLCQSNPTTSVCLAAPTSMVTTSIAANATPTFAIFVTSSATVPFDPAQNRIFVRFRDPANITRGSTSVAVQTQ